MMTRVARTLVLLVLALAVAVPVQAAEKKGGGRKGQGKGAQSATAMMQKKLDGLNLTAEQKTKVGEIMKQFEAKMAAARDKMMATLPADKKQEINKLRTKLQQSGVKARELDAKLAQELGLTAEQAKVWGEAQAALQKVQNDLRTAVMAVLTPEQKAQMAPAKGGGKQAKEGRRKKAG